MLLRIEQEEFLNKCLTLIDRLGEAKSDLRILGTTIDGKVYEDDVILIMKSDDNRWMEMERKYNNNPFFYLYEGNIIRFHGEYIFLEEHVEGLLKG